MNPYNPFSSQMIDLDDYIEKSPGVVKSIVAKKSEVIKKYLIDQIVNKANYFEC